ncbi:MAG: hypothetical protein FJX65_18900 [Alphaproteobacteria bacterium]|nr:hypothetical protein [Alphaproteobacteria bacterium]
MKRWITSTVIAFLIAVVGDVAAQDRSALERDLALGAVRTLPGMSAERIPLLHYGKAVQTYVDSREYFRRAQTDFLNVILDKNNTKEKADRDREITAHLRIVESRFRTVMGELNVCCETPPTTTDLALGRFWAKLPAIAKADLERARASTQAIRSMVGPNVSQDELAAALTTNLVDLAQRDVLSDELAAALQYAFGRESPYSWVGDAGDGLRAIWRRLERERRGRSEDPTTPMLDADELRALERSLSFAMRQARQVYERTYGGTPRGQLPTEIQILFLRFDANMQEFHSIDENLGEALRTLASRSFAQYRADPLRSQAARLFDTREATTRVAIQLHIDLWERLQAAR